MYSRCQNGAAAHALLERPQSDGEIGETRDGFVHDGETPVARDAPLVSGHGPPRFSRPSRPAGAGRARSPARSSRLACRRREYPACSREELAPARGAGRRLLPSRGRGRPGTPRAPGTCRRTSGRRIRSRSPATRTMPNRASPPPRTTVATKRAFPGSEPSEGSATEKLPSAPVVTFQDRLTPLSPSSPDRDLGRRERNEPVVADRRSTRRAELPDAFRTIEKATGHESGRSGTRSARLRGGRTPSEYDGHETADHGDQANRHQRDSFRALTSASTLRRDDDETPAVPRANRALRDERIRSRSRSVATARARNSRRRRSSSSSLSRPASCSYSRSLMALRSRSLSVAREAKAPPVNCGPETPRDPTSWKRNTPRRREGDEHDEPSTDHSSSSSFSSRSRTDS